jgi:two-component system copper resistance phosphate regulon response regulator CusR
VLDVMLPSLDGWGILQTLRRSGREMPVLFLTARDQVEDRVVARAGRRRLPGQALRLLRVARPRPHPAAQGRKHEPETLRSAIWNWICFAAA